MNSPGSHDLPPGEWTTAPVFCTDNEMRVRIVSVDQEQRTAVLTCNFQGATFELELAAEVDPAGLAELLGEQVQMRARVVYDDDFIIVGGVAHGWEALLDSETATEVLRRLVRERDAPGA